MAVSDATSNAASKCRLESKLVGDTWNVYLIEGDTSRLIETSSSWKQPVIEQVGTALYRVFVSCGSPCSYTTFVNTSTGEVDGKYFLVMKFDYVTMRVFYNGDDNKLASKVVFSRGKPRSYDLPNVASTAVVFLVIKDIEILSDGRVEVKYLSGKDYTETETIFR
jgi:hypothetical protein